ncbi:MAG: ankyrin repeat domain-containing protein [Sulfuricurvum sp.]|nr:ankyrin repeat domain-containing protein [Sulfuricurvum sp.]
MIKKIVFTCVLLFSSLQAADIIALVNTLDRNDSKMFESQIHTVQDANTMRDDNNKTILMYACWIGNEEAVKYLISKGANVNAQDTGGATALHLAAWKGFTSIALFLLKNGASGEPMSKDGMTPLDIAMMQGNQTIADAIKKAAPKLKPLL